MNITFLLGNGFDRALGLETGYKAFYKWYIKQAKDNLPEWVVTFRGEIDKYVHNDPEADAYWSDAEYGLGQYTEKFTIETVGKFIDCYEDFRDNLILYLKEQQALFSDELAVQARAYFAPQLVDYFQEVDPLEIDALRNQRNQESSVVSFANFICFNYTSAVDRVVAALATDAIGEWQSTSGSTRKLKMGKLIHAHGTLDMWPIIGVCNLQNIKNTALLESDEFKTIIQKSASINVTGQLWRRNTTETIRNSHVICVFGMSIGETDSDYWELLSEWLNGDSRRHLIVFWYDTKANNIGISVREKYREVNAVKEKLWDYSAWTNDLYEKVKKRIHVVIKAKNMFVLPSDYKAKQPDDKDVITINKGDTIILDCGTSVV